MALSLTLNGQLRLFEALTTPTTLDLLVRELGLKGDRVAVEHNGTIAPRAAWTGTALVEGDRVEVVHFVGGGAVSARFGKDA